MKQQIQYLIGMTLVLPLLPLLYFIGKNIRKKVPQLPEASINLEGEFAGTNEPIRILTIGESTIAGVGVTDHADGITGSIAKGLNQQTGKRIAWRVLARNGCTAQKVREEYINIIPDCEFDFIFIGLGGNDTFRLNSPLKFRKDLLQLIEELRRIQPNARIIILNMPPIADFPAFPKTVRFILGNLVDLHRKVIADIPQNFSDVFFNDEKISLVEWTQKSKNTEAAFFSDGVHPSALTYRIWGEETVTFLAKKSLL